MVRILLVLISIISLNALATPPSNVARLVSEKTENGIITRVYVQESLFDEHQYCYQLITVQYRETTEEFLSSDTEEICNRIR